MSIMDVQFLKSFIMIFKLSVRQREQFVCHEAGDIFPEYYVLRVDGFNQ